ncbi:L,D-transpeptidase [Piscinibacter sakaiensis]|uniref:L,D-transpeptidase n=1 Tax=Piscinibacter sakaiensis TaxID=1547922 RepID=UPI003AACA3C7
MVAVAAPLRAVDGHAAAGSDENRLFAADASADVRYLHRWIGQRNDSGGRPFAIVDKKQARMHIFDERQALVGSSVVLTGATPGDESVPGVGQRAQTGQIAANERTTPAGRFASQPGRNLKGEDIVWFDYDAALAIHRLRPDASYASRSKRLASATPDDNRASLGCVVVPVEFYQQVVQRWLGARRGVVYVLPERRPVQALWPHDAPAIAGLSDEDA